MNCICTGNQVEEFMPCTAAVTQEDFLCDHCRGMDCPTVTTPEILTERVNALYSSPKAAF